MKKALFVILAVSLCGPRAWTADICDDPYAAICDDTADKPTVTAEQIRKEVAAQLKTGSALASLSGDSSADAQAIASFQKYVAAEYQVLLKHFASLGISESDIMNRIKLIQNTDSDNFTSGRMGASAAESGILSNSGLAANIQKISFLSPKAVANLNASQNSDKIESYYESCGADGLLLQAYYESSNNQFTVCPGYLLSVLNAGTLDSIDFMVGHELTHSADPLSDPRVEGQAVLSNQAPLYQKYSGFLKCIDANYAKTFSTAAEVIDQLGDPAQKRLQDYLAILQAEPGDHSAEIAGAQLQMRTAREQVAELGYDLNRTQSLIGHAPSVADTHSRELTADYGGESALIELLHSIPQGQRLKAVATSLNINCASHLDPAKAVKYGPLKDDALHPEPHFRISNFMNNPQARALMGCKSLAGSGPWCNPNDASPIVAQCPAGGSNSSATCLKQMSDQLTKAACQFKIPSCTTDNANITCASQSSNCELAVSTSGNFTCPDKSVTAAIATGSPIPGLCVAASVPSSPNTTNPSSH